MSVKRWVTIRCPVCGKLSTGRCPRWGDGTFRYPRRHLGPDGEPCPGNIMEGEWVGRITEVARE